MGDILHDLLALGVQVLGKVIRALLVYVFLVVILRVAGKRQLAELTPLDLVIALTLSNAVQNAIIGDDNSVTGGVIGGTVLVVANYLTVRFLYRHPVADRLVEGEPVVLIEDGQVKRDALERELIAEDQLLEACREQGAEDLADVDRAILETGGNISAIVHHPSPEEAALAEMQGRLVTIEALLRGGSPRHTSQSG